MALHLNLLHEEILEQRQRQRDPLKIGMMVLGGIGALFLLYYLFSAYRTLEVKSRLSVAEAEWAKVEPKVTAAQKKSADLNNVIGTTRVLDDMIGSRIFWAPLLDRIGHCVTPNIQLTDFIGNIDPDGVLTISMEGLAAGREPRAVAEDLRELLHEQLIKDYPNVTVEFKTLEDVDTMVNIDGSSVPMVRFTLLVTCGSKTSASATPTPSRRAKHEKD